MKNLVTYSLSFILAVCFQHSYAGVNNVDSLFLVLKNGKEDTIRSNTYYQLGKIFFLKGKFDSSLLFVEKGIDLTRKLNFRSGLAYATNLKGAIYYYKGNYSGALKYYLTALKLNEERGEKKSIAQSYGNIGLVYLKLNNFEEALKNNKECLRIMIQLSDSVGIGRAYVNVGIIYRHQKKPMEALKQFTVALDLFERVDWKQGKADAYNNIGNVYGDLKNNADALENYMSALRGYESTGDVQRLSTTYINIADQLITMKKNAEARKYVEMSLKLSLKLDLKETIKTSYEALVKLDSLSRDFKSGFKHYKLQISYRDSLLNEENTKKTVQVQMQYDFDKIQATDSIRNSEQAKQEQLKHDQEIKQQKIYTYGGVIGFVLMLLVALVSFRAFKQKQDANRIIARQKELVEEKQKEVLDSIHYAKRIQQSLLPTDKYIWKNLKRLNK